MINVFLYFFLFLSDHEYHVGIYDIEYKGNQLLISQKLFADDMQKALNLAGNAVTFGDDINEIELSNALQKYIKNHFKIKINEMDLPLIFVGWEWEDYHSFYVYWECNITQEKFDGLEIFNNIFVEVSNEQKNMHRLKKGNMEESLLLDKNQTTGVIKVPK